MAGFANFPVSQNFDWTARDFIKQIIEALNERIGAAATTGSYGTGSWKYNEPDGSDVGWDLCTLAGTAGQDLWPGWATIQDELETICVKFINPNEADVDGSYNGNETWAGEELPFFTLATFFAAAGINASGWTRKYPREITALDDAGSNGQFARMVAGSGRSLVYEYSNGAWGDPTETMNPDTLTAYGQAQAGDYIGPWLFNEFQDACEQLIWTGGVVGEAIGHAVTFTSQETDPRVGKSGADGLAATKTEARSEANADWPDDWTSDPPDAGNTQDAFKFVFWWLNDAANGYRAALMARSIKMSVNLRLLSSPDIDWYFRAEYPGHEAEAGGVVNGVDWETIDFFQSFSDDFNDWTSVPAFIALAKRVRWLASDDLAVSVAGLVESSDALGDGQPTFATFIDLGPPPYPDLSLRGWQLEDTPRGACVVKWEANSGFRHY